MNFIKRRHSRSQNFLFAIGLLLFAFWISAPVAALAGQASEVTVTWEIHPDPLVFPETIVTLSSARLLAVTNTSEDFLHLDVTVADPAAGFAYEGADWRFDCHCIGPGSTIDLHFSFTPQAVGEQASQILLGGSIPPIDVSGVGTPALPDCLIQPAELNFGPIAASASDSAMFGVVNTGNVPLTIAPTESSPHFQILATNRTLDPGKATSFKVYFEPEAAGLWECDIDLGPEFCGPVHCVGEATWAPGDDENVVGFFFDPDFQQFELQAAANMPFAAYLVLLNCSSELGVGGWECRAGLQGNAQFLGWTLEGPAMNLNEAPDFLVGIGEPLPYSAGGILLATAIILALDTDPVVLTLEPLPQPTLPNEMAWLTGDNTQFWPMNPVAGIPEVAQINGGSITGIAAPLPAAVSRLLPNVPNPFNPRTEIRFEVENAGPIRITIHDVTGRLIRTLVNGNLATGPQSRTWNGRDDAGKRVSSGGYYVRLEADGGTDHRKVMLLK
jgi:FlgD Ig-like domain/HYDIN/CFA65/VesB-like, Ig-like domain